MNEMDFSYPLRQGWQCPVCHHCYSPAVQVCMFCPSSYGTFDTSMFCAHEWDEPNTAGTRWCKRCGQSDTPTVITTTTP